MASPSTVSSPIFRLSISETGPRDVYAIAHSRLQEKIGTTITQEEFDQFCGACLSCSRNAALDSLHAAGAGHANKHPTFRSFVRILHRFFAPLERFKSALDTYAQASDPVCLIWGTVKVILTVTQELKEVPELIMATFEELIDSLPVYEEYRLLIANKADCPLRLPLTRIYEEYLHFCILATREAEKPSYKIIYRAAISTRERTDLEQCIKVIGFQAKSVTRIAVSLTYGGVEGLKKMMETVIDNAKVQQRGNAPLQKGLSVSNIPGILSATFVGRERELNWLRDTLNSPRTANSRNRVGLYGMTGIGKTQIMLQYEHRFRSMYASRLYVTAGSSVKFRDSLDHLLHLLDIPDEGSSSVSQKTTALGAWLMANEDWLLLIDNVGGEEHGIILDLLPLMPKGHVILTSQRRGAMEKITGRLQFCFEVLEPSVEDATEILFESCAFERSMESENLARQVVKNVGCLPHAVKQSASYLKENGMSLEEYIMHYQKAPDRVLSWQDSYSSKRVAISKHFVMIFQYLEEQHPDAAALLRLFSLFEPEEIPIFDGWYREELDLVIPVVVTPPKLSTVFRTLARICCCFCGQPERPVPQSLPLASINGGDSEVVNLVKDTDRLYAAIAKLVDLSLVRRVGERRILWIHDLTQFTIKQTIAENSQTSWLLSALKSLYHAYPEKDNTLRERMMVDVYLPQAIKLVNRAQTSSIHKWEFVPLMALCAQSMCNRGMYYQAIEWFNIVLPEYQKHLGEKHRRTAAITHNMAVTHHQASDLDVAEATYKTAWNLRSEVCGENSLETLETMNKLAACIERQGRLKEGEAIFAKTYDGLKQKLGPADATTVAAAHNLALCYHNQGRIAEAENLYREALEISEEAFGAADLGTLKTLGNLAVTVDQSGRLSDAEKLYDRALASYTKLLGYDDMLTLRVRSNISGLYRQQGRLEVAESTIRDALNVFLTIFGPDHFHSAIALYDLGEVLQTKGSLHEAERYLMLSLKGMSTNSAQHPLAIRVIDALGILYRELGDFEKSNENTALAYERNKALLGEHDPFTLVSANSRAEYLHSERRYQQALDIYKVCLKEFRNLLPNGHPHILMVLNNLGRVAWLTKSSDPLIPLREAYEGFKTLVGADHPCTLTVAMNIARSEFAIGRVNAAQKSLTTIRDSYKAVLGNVHPHVGVVDFYLGMLLASRNEMAAARSHFQDAVDCFVKTFGTQHPNYVVSVCMLIHVLRRLEEFNDADAYQSIIGTQVHCAEAHRFVALGKFDLTYLELTAIQPSVFDWTSTISLPFGEHVRLRWGRKNVWREPEFASLDS